MQDKHELKMLKTQLQLLRKASRLMGKAKFEEALAVKSEFDSAQERWIQKYGIKETKVKPDARSNQLA